MMVPWHARGRSVVVSNSFGLAGCKKDSPVVQEDPLMLPKHQVHWSTASCGSSLEFIMPALSTNLGKGVFRAKGTMLDELGPCLPGPTQPHPFEQGDDVCQR